jgi:hypothetical protein
MGLGLDDLSVISVLLLISQVVSELRRTPYRPRMSVLGSKVLAFYRSLPLLSLSMSWPPCWSLPFDTVFVCLYRSQCLCLCLCVFVLFVCLFVFRCLICAFGCAFCLFLISYVAMPCPCPCPCPLSRLRTSIARMTPCEWGKLWKKKTAPAPATKRQGLFWSVLYLCFIILTSNSNPQTLTLILTLTLTLALTSIPTLVLIIIMKGSKTARQRSLQFHPQV